MTKKITIILTSLIITLSNTSAVIAGSFESSNDILFYDANSTNCADFSSGSSSSPSSSDNQKTTAEFLTSVEFSGNDNKPLNAVQMAALMGNIQQESGFNPNAFNPGSGNDTSYKGIVQWSSPGRWDSVEDPKTDLDNQLKLLKKELDGSYKNKLDEFWSASSLDDLDKATYAIVRNYEVAINKGKDNSSKTWTNSSDAIINVQDWTKRRDNASKIYNKYGSMAGGGYKPSIECGELVSGGMTLEQAKAFMQEYKSLEPQDWPEGTPGTKYDINGTDCSGGSLANCVAFSQYFINRYTNKKLTSPGNGEHVVGNLLSLGFKDGGHTPRVYAVFSEASSSTNKWGHTGVVLGIDIDNDEIIIGEAGCGLGMDWIDARRYSLSKFSGDNYTYAYTMDTPDEINTDKTSKEDK